MWNDDLSQLETLKKLSFIDTSVDPKIMVTSFMAAHVKNTIEPQDKRGYMKIICQYYIDMLLDFYQNNCVSSQPTEPQTAGT